MSHTFKWCKDKTKLGIWGKQVFWFSKFGNRLWLLNDEFHRVNGPAVELSNGDKSWYINGALHRENGAAAEYVNGRKSWYLNGVYYSESGYWKEMKK